jgi:hypothetical protein
MAKEKRTWVRQAIMKRSFMRSRTTAIYDCWLDPLAGARSGPRESLPTCGTAPAPRATEHKQAENKNGSPKAPVLKQTEKLKLQLPESDCSEGSSSIC